MEKIIELLSALGVKVRENVPMDKETTFRIGGKARLMAVPEDALQLSSVFKLFNKENVPYIVLGKCSNVLVPDKGIDKVIISTVGLKGITANGENIICGAGETLASVAETAKRNSLTGFEFAAGIPGSVGGAVYMNAGAYGGEIAQVIDSVTFVDGDGKISEYKVTAEDFGYRHSPFTDKIGCIAGATFTLQKGDATEIQGRMTELAKKRSASQPLSKPSAGSTFKRPVGGYAAALIDECGLKGCTVGGASVSEKHAGFIVNNGGATAEDVLKLIEHIKVTVKNMKNIQLETEVICL